MEAPELNYVDSHALGRGSALALFSDTVVVLVEHKIVDLLWHIFGWRMSISRGTLKIRGSGNREPDQDNRGGARLFL